ncbi:hypothetical protein EDI_138620 [Entamoeba dispar SAW760]|uniref:Uncharacterized protein n=1 Tax=Entamoeba dispar (strain ATCC PRA-260 / SAW760) TaxID=370354 RepID=B0EIF5_ENTDS|nr:uncharacterized protein EDI_138620 [Entamoeba dispar SAW760]EDR25684.1 hypothetical protein EDI_138620 [Entamoeba dispar SAW760]|eukprot:EDR25684.1 hypothetical protein EDI_138620 [Entamoeba dispar SAW760]
MLKFCILLGLFITSQGIMDYYNITSFPFNQKENSTFVMNLETNRISQNIFVSSSHNLSMIVFYLCSILFCHSCFIWYEPFYSTTLITLLTIIYFCMIHKLFHLFDNSLIIPIGLFIINLWYVMCFATNQNNSVSLFLHIENGILSLLSFFTLKVSRIDRIIGLSFLIGEILVTLGCYYLGKRKINKFCISIYGSKPCELSLFRLIGFVQIQCINSIFIILNGICCIFSLFIETLTLQFFHIFINFLFIGFIFSIIKYFNRDGMIESELTTIQLGNGR